MSASALAPRNALQPLKGAFAGCSKDNASSMGAALAFYSLLSMAPLLVLVITIAGLFVGAVRAQELLMTQLSGLLGDTGAEGVSVMLKSANTSRDGLVQAAISFATLLLGATTVFAELQSDLNRIWRCDARKSAGFWR